MGAVSSTARWIRKNYRCIPEWPPKGADFKCYQVVLREKSSRGEFFLQGTLADLLGEQKASEVLKSLSAKNVPFEDKYSTRRGGSGSLKLLAKLPVGDIGGALEVGFRTAKEIQLSFPQGFTFTQVPNVLNLKKALLGLELDDATIAAFEGRYIWIVVATLTTKEFAFQVKTDSDGHAKPEVTAPLGSTGVDLTVEAEGKGWTKNDHAVHYKSDNDEELVFAHRCLRFKVDKDTKRLVRVTTVTKDLETDKKEEKEYDWFVGEDGELLEDLYPLTLDEEEEQLFVPDEEAVLEVVVVEKPVEGGANSNN